MPGRTFTREFKLDVVRQIASGAKRPAQICREYNLAESVLNRINRSWYLTRPSEHEVLARDVALRDAIEHIILEFPGYGYRRVTEELHRRLWQVNHKRVLRIMRRESLLCHLKRRFVPTTDSQHGLQRYPNLLRACDVHGPNEAWVADITYVCLPTTFVYLACILDAFSRRCVGWELAPWLDTRLTLAA